MPFRALLDEMWNLPKEHRAEWVRQVILSDEALAARGIVVPAGMTLQRSAFADNRPTLFCVTKHLPPGLHWHKVTITFDNPSGPPAIRFEEVKDAVTL
jgi:hypothetical protein